MQYPSEIVYVKVAAVVDGAPEHVITIGRRVYGKKYFLRREWSDGASSVNYVKVHEVAEMLVYLHLRSSIERHVYGPGSEAVVARMNAGFNSEGYPSTSPYSGNNGSFASVQKWDVASHVHYSPDLPAWYYRDSKPEEGGAQSDESSVATEPSLEEIRNGVKKILSILEGSSDDSTVSLLKKQVAALQREAAKKDEDIRKARLQWAKMQEEKERYQGLYRSALSGMPSAQRFRLQEAEQKKVRP